MELLPVVNVEPELGVLEGEAWAWDQPELAAEVDKEEEKELRRRLDQLQRAEEAELEAARARLGQERARLLADLAEDTQVLYCTVLYCTVLYCTVLYCTGGGHAGGGGGDAEDPGQHAEDAESGGVYTQHYRLLGGCLEQNQNRGGTFL